MTSCVPDEHQDGGLSKVQFLVLQDLEKHRDVALEYITYFESTLLPSKTSDAPRGTRLERIEVIYCILYHIPSKSSSHTVVQSCYTFLLAVHD